jgi:diadenylate cyclase
MRLGVARWLRPWARDVGEVVEHLVGAAEYFAKNKIGAIIAIEREVALGATIESGRRLDAELSADLLKTIFWPGSAMHDLGVVIQRGRVAAAACQFPLAESDELDRTLGGRHRAAVGMSNDSDAVVLVVSEETGAISLAERGRLEHGLGLQELRRRLLTMLAVSGPGVAGSRRAT